MRTIDPREHNERAAQEHAGYVPVRDLVRQDRQLQRFGGDPQRNQRAIVFETLTWYRADIGASGDAAYLGRVGWPSSDSAWAMGVLPLVTPTQGRIVAVRLWSNAVITAGTVQARVRVIEDSVTTDVTYETAELDAVTNTRQAAQRIPWDVAHQFAAGATLEGRFVTAGTMAPTTADVVMQIVVGYEDWV